MIIFCYCCYLNLFSFKMIDYAYFLRCLNSFSLNKHLCKDPFFGCSCAFSFIRFLLFLLLSSFLLLLFSIECQFFLRIFLVHHYFEPNEKSTFVQILMVFALKQWKEWRECNVKIYKKKSIPNSLHPWLNSVFIDVHYNGRIRYQDVFYYFI